MNHSPNRFERQAALVSQADLAVLQVTVIGVGAIGRQAALQLAALGARQLKLIDFDRVEPTNITTQGYRHGDLGLLKVEATAQALRQIEPELELTLVADRYRPAIEIRDAIFCCVDSIAARSAIWRSAGRRVQFWSDGRMLGEVLRILTVANEAGRRHYPTTLFESAEAQTGTCTAKGTIYTAAIAAGLMVEQFSRSLRGMPVDRDLSLNLLTSELAVN